VKAALIVLAAITTVAVVSIAVMLYSQMPEPETAMQKVGRDLREANEQLQRFNR
jgi:hypothetical protein